MSLMSRAIVSISSCPVRNTNISSFSGAEPKSKNYGRMIGARAYTLGGGLELVNLYIFYLSREFEKWLRELHFANRLEVLLHDGY